MESDIELGAGEGGGIIIGIEACSPLVRKLGYDIISGESVVLRFLFEVTLFGDVASAGRLGTLALLGRRV